MVQGSWLKALVPAPRAWGRAGVARRVFFQEVFDTMSGSEITGDLACLHHIAPKTLSIAEGVRVLSMAL